MPRKTKNALTSDFYDNYYEVVQNTIIVVNKVSDSATEIILAFKVYM